MDETVNFMCGRKKFSTGIARNSFMLSLVFPIVSRFEISFEKIVPMQVVTMPTDLSCTRGGDLQTPLAIGCRASNELYAIWI